MNQQVVGFQQLTADNNRQEQPIRDLKIAIDSKLAELEAGERILLNTVYQW
ncbi:hypothetical protein [Microcoleus sp. POL10_C6]|uniref:hypothetical protein n=1 Tax=Microcoleus sp. POL10_C6 TaxID=2818852 RepID=UPI002FD6C607